MTFFEDLSHYEYLGAEEQISIADGHIVFEPAYTRLNVGWLTAERPYPRGRADERLVAAIRRLTGGQRINLTRGWHWCEFCAHEGEEAGETEEARGNGEIRVPGGPGIMYAAPVLLGHYVTEHGYLPPGEFVTALLAYDATGDRLDEPSWIPADAAREIS